MQEARSFLKERYMLKSSSAFDIKSCRSVQVEGLSLASKLLHILPHAVEGNSDQLIEKGS